MFYNVVSQFLPFLFWQYQTQGTKQDNNKQQQLKTNIVVFWISFRMCIWISWVDYPFTDSCAPENPKTDKQQTTNSGKGKVKRGKMKKWKGKK